MARNILIVDDSLTIRSSLEYCLKEAGFNVVAAVDGIDGIEKLKSMKDSGVSVIITDVNMPRMDGITFTENVKKSSFRSTPVLILTTETQESRKQQGRAAGAAGWLVKPFQPEQLIAVINKVTQ
ncbi:response regulator [candidate division KSB1 bacterium]|nr:response regulator [candidate division KSB1 bacterium]